MLYESKLCTPKNIQQIKALARSKLTYVPSKTKHFLKGKITHDPEATIEKIARQQLKYPPVEKTGFQLLGMRVNLALYLSYLI